METLLPDTNSMRKGDLMRFHLLRTNAQNKCDTVFRAEHAALQEFHNAADLLPFDGREV